jgi:hypothetical protein
MEMRYRRAAAIALATGVRGRMLAFLRAIVDTDAPLPGVVRAPTDARRGCLGELKTGYPNRRVP